MAEHTLALCAAGLATGLAAGALAAGYQFGWRGRLANWGATPEEIRLPLPGDNVRADVDLVTTRAIAISAPPSCVWPWLVQMGSGRGGAYSYDWVENLMGLDMHSADVILPQFQDLAIGDEFPVAGRGGVMRVAALEPERQLVFSCGEGRWVASYALLPQRDKTRLISRNRIVLCHDDWPGSKLARALLIEPCWLVFERKMLIGIKDRAERLARHSELTAAGPVPSSFHWTGEEL